MNCHHVYQVFPILLPPLCTEGGERGRGIRKTPGTRGALNFDPLLAAEKSGFSSVIRASKTGKCHSVTETDKYVVSPMTVVPLCPPWAVVSDTYQSALSRPAETAGYLIAFIRDPRAHHARVSCGGSASSVDAGSRHEGHRVVLPILQRRK